MTVGDLRGAISEGRRRDGGRHPGCRDGVALRGATQERWSWSVQRVGRVSSRFVRRADDSGCPLVAEEGHVSLFEADVLRSVQRLVSLVASRACTRNVGLRCRGRANLLTQEEPAAARSAADAERVLTSLPSQEEQGIGRGSRPSSSEDTRARGSWPVRRVSLQKSSGDAWSRKARVSGLQKGASARVDGDLA